MPQRILAQAGGWAQGGAFRYTRCAGRGILTGRSAKEFSPFAVKRGGGRVGIIRRAVRQDLDAVALLFDRVLSEEEAGRCAIGWKRGIYPTRATAEAALEKDDLFVLEDAGRVVAAIRLNMEQVPEYSNADWLYKAGDDEVMVAHTLVVDPALSGRGYGRQMIAYYEDYARQNGCPVLRMDTNAINARARALYRHLGYREAGIVDCVFNGLENVRLVCLEKKLDG